MKNPYIILAFLMFIIIILLGVLFQDNFMESMESTIPSQTEIGKTTSEIISDLNKSTEPPKFTIDTHEYIPTIKAEPSKSSVDEVTLNPQLDINGNNSTYKFGEVSPPITYIPSDASRPYPVKYVPNYENSIYLSRTSGESQVGYTYNTSLNTNGFCAQNSNSFDDIDKNCSALNLSTCASTTCCVLLGGSKCVAGNMRGPLSKSNYIDPFLKNKDLYYYQGKCYGNCEKPGDFVSSVN